MIVAIDGPAGSGKSTISKKVASRLKYFHLDTGAMYRALTLAAMKKNVDFGDESALLDVAQKAVITMDLNERNEQCVLLDGLDVTSDIRLPEVTNEVKHIAKIPAIRDILVNLQRQIAEGKNVVLEGRDTTTVVFPNADHKIYLDACQKERAQRRFIELQEKGLSVTFEEVLTDQQKRDESDFNRAVGPLKKADDAVVVDTSGMTIDEVVGAILSIVGGKKKSERSFWYTFYKTISRIIVDCCFGLRVMGEENIPSSGPVILASNHVSYLDPVIVGGKIRRDCHYLARESLFTGNRLFGKLIRACNAHPIKRGRADRQALSLAKSLLVEGKAVVLFPEGTRSYDGTVGPAKAGIGFLACNCACPVVPVYVHGAADALPRGSKKIRFRTPLTVTYGKVLHFSGEAKDSAKRDLYEHATHRIMEEIKRLQKDMQCSA